jgi:phosphoglycerol transferase MdoB-like AlkP superfamily enzyme
VVARLGLIPLFPATALLMGVGFLFAFGFTVGCLFLAEVQAPADPLAWVFAALLLAFFLGFPVALLFVQWNDPRDIEFLKRFLASTLSPMTPPR